MVSVRMECPDTKTIVNHQKEIGSAKNRTSDHVLKLCMLSTVPQGRQVVAMNYYGMVTRIFLSFLMAYHDFVSEQLGWLGMK